MTAAGKRLITVRKDTVVSAWDVGAGRKLWETEAVVAKSKPPADERAADAAKRFTITDPELKGVFPSHDGGRVFVSLGRNLQARGGYQFSAAERVLNTHALIDGTTGRVIPIEWPARFKTYVARTASFSRDGRLLAIGMLTQFGGNDFAPITSVWDVATGTQIQSWDGYGMLAFAPDRDVLAIVERKGANARVGFWEFAPAK